MKSFNIPFAEIVDPTKVEELAKERLEKAARRQLRQALVDIDTKIDQAIDQILEAQAAMSVGQIPDFVEVLRLEGQILIWEKALASGKAKYLAMFGEECQI